MNLLDKASIILTPSAYNNGEALCVKPSDGSGDFDFSRNSAATRVNAQGLVEDVQILSSNLVQNGDFSEQGAEEVSNGSFSQQGSQLITNGDFATDSDWTMQAGWSISNGKLNALATNGIAFQSNLGLVIGKTYKVSLTTSNYVSGSARLKLGGSAYQNISTTDGNQEFYFIPTASNDNIIFSYLSTFTGSIDNVSVVEVGQNWTFTSGATLTDLGAKITHTPTAGQISQVNSLVIGKNYKFTYEITQSVSGGLKLNSAVNRPMVTSIGVHTKYFEADETSFVVKRNNAASNDVTITNISVKEVGQNWSLLGDFKVNNQEAYITNASQYSQLTNQIGVNYLLSGKKYKLELDIETLSISGAFAYRYTGGAVTPILTSDIQNGKYIAYFTMPSNGYIWLQTTGSYNGLNVTVSNISVIEITDDTNLPRINYEGFSYQDALGSEQVTNGDFSNGVTDWNAGGGATISVANNQLTIEADNDFNFYARQTVSGFIVGKQYKLTIDVAGGTTSKINVGVFGEGILINNQPILIGKQSVIFTITNGADGNRFLDINNRNDDGVNDTLIINNVSVKEYLGQEVVPDSGCGSWLWEPQSTNLVTQSELFSDSSWVKLGAGTGSVAIVTSNYAISPDGTLNASRLQCDLNSGGSSSSNQSLIYDIYSSSGNQTISIYVKSNNGQNQTIYFANTQTSGDTIIVTPEWQRFTFSHSVSTYIIAVGLRGRSVGAIDDTADILLFAAQAEEQSYATSYIPTSGTSVTRNQDVCTNGGSLASINSTEGVLYAEIKSLITQDTVNPNRYITLTNDTSNERVALLLGGNSNQLRAIIFSSTQSINLSFTTSLTEVKQFNKLAIKYKSGDYAFFLNGIKIGGSTETNIFSSNTLNDLSFDVGGGTQKFFGKTKCLAVWKEALTDTELAELTTI